MRQQLTLFDVHDIILSQMHPSWPLEYAKACVTEHIIALFHRIRYDIAMGYTYRLI